MNKTAQRKSQCRGCSWYNRCSVHWGQDCSRKGGTIIPRSNIIPPEYSVAGLDLDIKTMHSVKNTALKKSKPQVNPESVRTRKNPWPRQDPSPGRVVAIAQPTTEGIQVWAIN